VTFFCAKQRTSNLLRGFLQFKSPYLFLVALPLYRYGNQARAEFWGQRALLKSGKSIKSSGDNVIGSSHLYELSKRAST